MDFKCHPQGSNLGYTRKIGFCVAVMPYYSSFPGSPSVFQKHVSRETHKILNGTHPAGDLEVNCSGEFDAS